MQMSGSSGGKPKPGKGSGMQLPDIIKKQGELSDKMKQGMKPVINLAKEINLETVKTKVHNLEKDKDIMGNLMEMEKAMPKQRWIFTKNKNNCVKHYRKN